MVKVATVFPPEVVKVGKLMGNLTPGLLTFSAHIVVLLMVDVVINSLKVTDIVGLVFEMIWLGGLGIYDTTVGGVISGGESTVNVVVLWLAKLMPFRSLMPVLAQAVYWAPAVNGVEGVMEIVEVVLVLGFTDGLDVATVVPEQDAP